MRHAAISRRFRYNDPYDPKSTPVKRTALGRAAHECATHAVSHDGRVAFYSGDDARMEYVFKFVTDGRHDPSRPEKNRDLFGQRDALCAVASARDEVGVSLSEQEGDGTGRTHCSPPRRMVSNEAHGVLRVRLDGSTDAFEHCACDSGHRSG